MQTHTPYIDPGIKLSVEQFGRWAQQKLQLDPWKMVCGGPSILYNLPASFLEAFPIFKNKTS